MEENSVLAEVGETKRSEDEVTAVKETPKTPAQYLDELKQEIESISDPNEGRIQELRDLIKRGKLATKEAVRESAEKLGELFLSRRLF
ncbi:MAG: hypothetical protein HY714_00695 [Candidatus Omnitrophica bacterium]|nr:hypothetical protein [Candidatus Omnitrophota bacterium]